MKKRGQISFEYITLVAVVTVLILFILGISQFYSQQIKTIINSKQVDTLAKDIIDNAESVYYYGPPTKTTIKVQMPEGVQSIEVSSDDILFVVNTAGGSSSLFYPSSVPLVGNLSPHAGIHILTIEARGNTTWINGT